MRVTQNATNARGDPTDLFNPVLGATILNGPHTVVVAQTFRRYVRAHGSLFRVYFLYSA